jgi:hypothetical protein
MQAQQALPDEFFMEVYDKNPKSLGLFSRAGCMLRHGLFLPVERLKRMEQVNYCFFPIAKRVMY